MRWVLALILSIICIHCTSIPSLRQHSLLFFVKSPGAHSTQSRQASRISRFASPAPEKTGPSPRASSGMTKPVRPQSWWQLFFSLEGSFWMFIAGIAWSVRRLGRLPLIFPYLDEVDRPGRVEIMSLDTLNRGYMYMNYAYMAIDSTRNALFREGIRAAGVRGRTALEIGCGPLVPLTEILIEEGASSVAAIEGNDWAAQRAACKLGEVAMVYSGLSQEVFPSSYKDGSSSEPSGKAEVVVMETVSDVGSLEWMIPTYLDARERLCVPGAVWIPGRVVTWIAPMTEPLDLFGSAPATGVWSLKNQHSPEEWLVSGPAVLEEYSFNAFTEAQMRRQERWHNFQVEKDSATFGGFLLWVEVWPRPDGEGPSLSALRNDTNWQPLFVAMPRRKLHTGDVLRCRTLAEPAAEAGPRVFVELATPNSDSIVCRVEINCQTSQETPTRLDLENFAMKS